MNSLRTVLAASVILLAGSLLFASGAAAIDFKAAPNSPLTELGPDGKGAVTGDFGGGPADDIVSVSESEGSSLGGGIYMLINDGLGNFTETAESACSPGDESPCLNDWPIAGIYKADFDQDGNPDVLTVREGLDRLTVWRGDGDGHLGYGGSIDPARPLPRVNSLAIGDVNQDDYPDIVVGFNGGDFGAHINKGISGPGEFTPAPPVIQSVTGAGANDDDYFGSVAIGDYNGGGVDIAFGQVACTEDGPGCATPYPASNAVFIADGNGSPIDFIGATGNPHPVPAGQVITDVATIQVDVEFTPPGLAVATASGTGGEIRTFVGHTSLALAPNPSADANIQTGGVPSALAAGRLDTDPISDLAWIENGTSAGIAVQTGEGAFSTEPNGPFAIPSDNEEFSSISIGSFTANGAAGMAFGGSDPDSQTGTVSALLPADEFKVDPTLDFGNVETGSTKTLPLNIYNRGVFSNYLMDQEIAEDVSGGFSITDHGNCVDAELAAGATCTIMVTFSPTTSGNHVAKALTNRDGPGAETSLSGTGTDPVPDPDPDPDPKPVTRVSLKLKSVGKVRPGGKVKVRAIVRNTGNQPISRLVLKTRVPKKLAKARKQAIIKRIAPGKTVRRTFIVKVKPKAKRGKKVVVKIQARLAGKTLRSARKAVKIKR